MQAGSLLYVPSLPHCCARQCTALLGKFQSADLWYLYRNTVLMLRLCLSVCLLRLCCPAAWLLCLPVELNACLHVVCVYQALAHLDQGPEQGFLGHAVTICASMFPAHQQLLLTHSYDIIIYSQVVNLQQLRQ